MSRTTKEVRAYVLQSSGVYGQFEMVRDLLADLEDAERRLDELRKQVGSGVVISGTVMKCANCAAQLVVVDEVARRVDDLRARLDIAIEALEDASRDGKHACSVCGHGDNCTRCAGQMTWRRIDSVLDKLKGGVM